MGDPIINPWIFYYANIADKLGFLLIAIAIFSIGVAIYEQDVNNENSYTIIKYALIVFMTTIILTVFIPNEKTVMQMYFASFTTQENIEKANNNIYNLIDYIVSKSIEMSDIKKQKGTKKS